MRSIWSFVARPEPVKASFTSDGAYSNTGSPACAAAASATPRAWPSTRAERGDAPQKTCSIEHSAEPVADHLDEPVEDAREPLGDGAVRAGDEHPRREDDEPRPLARDDT